MIATVLRLVGWPARTALLGVLWVYRRTLSPLLGSRCRFHPSCSAYAEEAIRTRGATIGSALAVWRVLRCSPLSTGGFDPVPLPRRRPGRAVHERAAYDVVIHQGSVSS